EGLALEALREHHQHGARDRSADLERDQRVGDPRKRRNRDARDEARGEDRRDDLPLVHPRSSGSSAAGSPSARSWWAMIRRREVSIPSTIVLGASEPSASASARWPMLRAWGAPSRSPRGLA